MRWYDEVTKELIKDFKDFSATMVFRLCGPNKVKMTKEKMNKLVMTSQCRGSVSTLDDFLKLVENEEKIDKDFILANIHIIRMNIWNEAVLYSDGSLKKIELETAMKINPDMCDLLSPEKYKFREVGNA